MDLRAMKLGTGRIAGWLQWAPDTWLHQLIGSISPDDRLALFATSRQLARHVVHCAPSVALHFNKARTGNIEAPRATITRLLDEKRQFQVKIDQRGPQPVPVLLTSSIISLSAWACGEGTSIDWGMFSSIETLDLRGGISAGDIDGLQAALQAGQLQQLCNLTLRVYDGSSSCSTADWAALACALGPRLRHLSTTVEPLLSEVQHMTALQSVEAVYCTLGAKALQQLCAHPTLCNVSLHSVQACAASKQLMGISCKWTKLTINDVPKGLLAVLPLANLKVLHFKGTIAFSQSDCHAVRMVLDQQTTDVVCEAGINRCGGRELDISSCLCTETVQLVQHMKGEGPISISYAVQDLHMVSKLWAVLPAEVHAVQFFCAMGVDWSQLWHGLPTTIERVCLYDCDIPVSVVAQLVRTAPQHVHVMKWVPPTSDDAEAWAVLRLHTIVPAHLSFIMKHV